MSLAFAPFAIANDIGVIYPGEERYWRYVKPKCRSLQNSWRGPSNAKTDALGAASLFCCCSPLSTRLAFHLPLSTALETQLERSYSRSNSNYKEQFIYALYKISLTLFPPPRTSYSHAHHGEHFPSQRLHAKMHLPRRTIPSSTDQFSRRRTPPLP